MGALAWGTETLPRVDKIVGPGNAYVASAKRQVFGRVAIDSIAGPSEIVVLADAHANPTYAAADLLSQAEHDARASAVLVTPSADLAAAVAAEVTRLAATLPRRAIVEASLRDYSAILVAASMDEAVDMVNRLAPEHLELLVPGPVGAAAAHPPCGRHLPRRARARAHRRLLRRARTTCCPPAARPATRAPSACTTSCGARA